MVRAKKKELAVAVQAVAQSASTATGMENTAALRKVKELRRRCEDSEDELESGIMEISAQLDALETAAPGESGSKRDGLKKRLDATEEHLKR